MPLAVTHVILTIVAIDIVRDYVLKKKFPMYFVLIGGIAGLLPDADLPLSWLLGAFGIDAPIHRVYTHSLLFPFLFLIAAYAFYKINNSKHKIGKIGFDNRHLSLLFAMISAGWFIHVLLDCSFMGSEAISFIPVISTISFCPHIFNSDAAIGLDAVILLGWLIHEQVRHKIKDYI